MNGTSSTEERADDEEWADDTRKADHVVGDVSFSIPQRKRLKLEWISASGEGSGGMRAVAGDGGVEFGCTWGDIGMFTLSSWLRELQCPSS